jgi:plastocyanin
MPEIWVQLENHTWDLCPNNKGLDRMTNQTEFQRSGKLPSTVTLTSPITGHSQTRTMFSPLGAEALLYRRYTANWAAPDDRKVNPWDVNEPDPTDTGTMGTIPGPVLECNVGESFTIHFRNFDQRSTTSINIIYQEFHIFSATIRIPSDIQTVVTPFPDDQRTHSLHPHGVVFANSSDGAYPLSPPDAANIVPVGLQTDPILAADQTAWVKAGFAPGAQKQGDRVPPGGIFTYTWNTFGWPTTGGVWLYHDHSIYDTDNVSLGAIGIIVVHDPNDPQDVIVAAADAPGGNFNGSPVNAGVYRTPPNNKALYLQLFHSLTGAGMLVNGRKYLGNTPTMVAGRNTLMRFGVVGMGSESHTFHIHGHRWVIPAAQGTALNANNAGSNPMVGIASQFEDTRVFGPANSFVFSIQEGTSFMRAEPPVGEWHMHCHVLDHMMQGMMGSLLVVDNGQAATPLPVGVPVMMGMPGQVMLQNNSFIPANIMIAVGGKVTWTHNDGTDPHTVTSNGFPGAVFNCSPSSPEKFSSGAANLTQGQTYSHTFNTAGTFNYHCEVHGCMMSGSVTVM